jgi:tetratricopeptide (TPR) repeat protein
LDKHRGAQVAEAELIYRKILAQQPTHADALHLLGMLKYQNGDLAVAIELIQKAIAASPNQAVFHSNLGLVLVAARQLDAAIVAYHRSLELAPRSAQAMNNLGAALHATGKTDEAIPWLRQSLEIAPDYGDARNNLAHILRLKSDSAREAKQPKEALRFCRESVALNPNDAEALYLLGSQLHDAGQSEAAVEFLRKSLQLVPDSAHTLNNLGNALFATGSQEESLDCLQRALRINPDFPEACNNLGGVLKAMGRTQEAIAAYSRSIALQPKSPDVHSNLGNLLREAGQRELALQSYESALAIDADHAVTHNNLGNSYCETGDWHRAIQSYRQALAIRPDYADAMNNLGTALEEIGQREEAMTLYCRSLVRQPGGVSAPWNIALLQLLRGEYEPGWPGYENRWRQSKQKNSFRNFTQPMLPILSGEHTGALKGKRVLLHAEQGYGDTLQFCRYAPMVAALGMTVYLECAPELIRLMSSLAGVAELIPFGTPLPAVDFQCPLMSLPMVFGTALATVPADVPYLKPNRSDMQRWGERFSGEPVGLRVGLVWAGGSNHQKDRDRSLRLADFAGLANAQGVIFYSLQLGEPAAQSASPPPGMKLIDWTEDLNDFADTAAMLTHLDLIITIDSSVGHLAGAMGKTVWTLLAFHPDWRWLLDRNDSPWYPNTNLFRQTSPKDWRDPLARVKAALAALSSRRG